MIIRPHLWGGKQQKKAFFPEGRTTKTFEYLFFKSVPFRLQKVDDEKLEFKQSRKDRLEAG